jgi:dolichyl-phosphate-mannose-protein mannosyltransferase
MLKSHLGYTVVHPMSSHWYTWFLPKRPIFLRRDVDADGTIYALITLGNPLLWWSSTAAVVAAAHAVTAAGPRIVWQQIQDGLRPYTFGIPWFGSAGDRPNATAGSEDAAQSEAQRPQGAPIPLPERAGLLFWVLAAWAAPVLFWIPSLRDSYIYHYMPSYAFALVLLAGFLERFYRRNRLLALAALLVVFEVTIFYAPLWGELPISQGALNARLFRFWR